MREVERAVGEWTGRRQHVDVQVPSAARTAGEVVQRLLHEFSARAWFRLGVDFDRSAHRPALTLRLPFNASELEAVAAACRDVEAAVKAERDESIRRSRERMRRSRGSAPPAAAESDGPTKE